MMEEVDWDLLFSYAGLLGLAIASIYTGSFGSLPRSRPKQLEKKPGENDVKVEEEDDEDVERMSSDDAWLFPIIGSMALLGLYTIVKYFGTAWINLILGWYFSIAGIGSVWKSMISLARWIFGEGRWMSFDNFVFTIQKNRKSFLSLSLRTPTLVLLPLAFLPSIIYNITAGSRKSVLITNILGLSFSHNALSFLKLDSFKTGCILLGGLFFYDIWWVFGTEVMVQVATSLDVPIKVLWPKSLDLSSKRGYTMLGLGDIVIPGTFIALALRYDYYRHTMSSQSRTTSFSKPYFYASLSAYILGLITTMTVMHVFHMAQPALLYLSPACILSFIVTAWMRGEWKVAWSWNDDPLEGLQQNGKHTNAGTGDTKVETTASAATNGHGQHEQETRASTKANGKMS